jgi:hypothetical protein
MLHHKLGEARWQSKIDESSIAVLLHALHSGNPVYVPLDKMTAETVARAKGALEIDSAAHGPVTNGCTPKCRHHGGHGKPSWAMGEHREAGAVHRDALAVDEIDVARRDAQLTTGVGLRDVDDLANVVD